MLRHKCQKDPYKDFKPVIISWTNGIESYKNPDVDEEVAAFYADRRSDEKGRDCKKCHGRGVERWDNKSGVWTQACLCVLRNLKKNPMGSISYDS